MNLGIFWVIHFFTSILKLPILTKFLICIGRLFQLDEERITKLLCVRPSFVFGIKMRPVGVSRASFPAKYSGSLFLFILKMTTNWLTVSHPTLSQTRYLLNLEWRWCVMIFLILNRTFHLILFKPFNLFLIFFKSACLFCSDLESNSVFCLWPFPNLANRSIS